jgi:hypothetical protein
MMSTSWIKFHLRVMVLTSTDNLWQYRLRQSSFHMHLVVIYHLLIHFSHPPPVSMLAPRNQTSGFCRSNIELGERGALFLSNYMKLQQLSQFLAKIVAFRKICTLGVHVSAQRNSMVAMKKFHSQLLSKHLNFEVTIQPAASYLVKCQLYSD